MLCLRIECLTHATEFGCNTFALFVAPHGTWLGHPISEQDVAKSPLCSRVRLRGIICWDPLDAVRDVVRHEHPELKAEDHREKKRPVPGRLSDTRIRSAMMSGHHQRPDRFTTPGWVRQLLRDPGEPEEQRDENGAAREPN